MKSFIAAVCIAGVSSLTGIAGQEVLTQTIRGSVYEKATMTPLPGANVILLDSDPVKGASADVDGKFRIDDVPVGRVGIKVSFLGFRDVVLTALNLTSWKFNSKTGEMEYTYQLGLLVIPQFRIEF